MSRMMLDVRVVNSPIKAESLLFDIKETLLAVSEVAREAAIQPNLFDNVDAINYANMNIVNACAHALDFLITEGWVEGVESPHAGAVKTHE